VVLELAIPDRVGYIKLSRAMEACMAAKGKAWSEGAATGVLGAAGVALWFLVIDLVHGEFLRTPAALGKALSSVLGHGITDHGTLFYAAGYTVFHVAAFVGVGVLASKLVQVSERVPQVTVALMLIFAVLECGFYFLAAFLSEGNVLGAFAWYQVGAANLVAAALMGGYLWRRHPALKPALQHALEGSV
jgi:hypothetical protein